MDLKKLNEGLRMANDICDIFIKVISSMGINIFSKGKLGISVWITRNLRAITQENVTKSFISGN